MHSTDPIEDYDDANKMLEGGKLDEDYANDLRPQTDSTSRKIQGGAATTKVRCYRVCVVSLGLLCVLLLAVIIWMVTKHTAERDQQQRNMDLLQLINNNLTQERDHLLAKSTDLTKEKDQLQISKDQVDQENDQLRAKNIMLTKEKNDLRAEIQRLASSPSLIAQGWIYFGSSFYNIPASEKTWAEGRQDCMDLGGHLVIIDSEEEQNFLYGLKKRAWIGLSDIETEGRWKWVNGKVLDEAGYWAEGEPNHLDNEDCVEILASAESMKGWNDNVCSERKTFICEKDFLEF